MRAFLGFIALHAALIGVGLALLRACGLAPGTSGRRGFGFAMGPALLAGAALVVPVLIGLLVLGVPLTLWSAASTCVVCGGVAELVARRRAVPARSGTGPASPSGPERWARRVGITLAGAYTIGGALALGRVSTVLDDARIWSLRGVTLADYHGLRPEIFLNPGQSGTHPVYPLFQPVLEALVFEALGRPQLRFFHAELWLLFIAAIWTAALLIHRLERSQLGTRGGRLAPAWLAVLGLLAVTPAAIHNLGMGYADITGSVILAAGALALAAWLDRGDSGLLALAVVLLAAAASTKDEDLIASVLVLVIGGIVSLTKRGDARFRPVSLRQFGAGGLYFVVLVAPWRLWVRAHHLSDSVQPPLPHSLSPAYILGRTHELHLAATAMLTQTLAQWGWLAALFLATCAVCIITRTARRVTAFYLLSFAALVVALLWLYTTTQVSLAFLLPTSMGRTVDVFMILSGVATAHLIAALALRGETRNPSVASQTRPLKP